MADGSDFPQHNRVFTAPVFHDGTEDDRVSSLPVFDNGMVIVSCWTLSEEELLEVIASKKIYLALWSRGIQPQFIGSESAVREMIADHGVWPK